MAVGRLFADGPRRSGLVPLCWAVGGLVALGAGALAGGCYERHEGDEEPVLVNGCTDCHGAADRVGTPVEQAAPPVDLSGSDDTSLSGVGAHQIHLTAGSRHGPVACEQCHVVPDSATTPGHADTARPAEVVFGSLASEDGSRSPKYFPNSGTCQDTYCHRLGVPQWTAPRGPSKLCGSCHGLPPPDPHPQYGECYRCHGSVIAATMAFVAPERHVDGTVDVATPQKCFECHGSATSPAPPPDLQGDTEPTVVGVGAHEAHLSGGTFSRPVPCGACHVVPAEVTAAGHLDGTERAEVIFAGAAVAGDHQPMWSQDEVRCFGSWCHGPSSPDAPPSSVWTSALPVGCGSCHALPPPDPHEANYDCTSCHAPTVSGPAGGVGIAQRELHGDGVVQLVDPPSGEATR